MKIVIIFYIRDHAEPISGYLSGTFGNNGFISDNIDAMSVNETNILL